MKKISLTLFIIMLTISLSAQNGRPLFGASNKDYSQPVVKKHWTEKTSGEMLQSASKNFIISASCMLAGGGLGVGAAFVDSKDTEKVMYISAGVLGVCSLFTFIQGSIDIGRAGKLREREQPIAQIRPSKNGLGINVTF